MDIRGYLIGANSGTDQEQDQRILEITKNLCQQLNITSYNPNIVSWTALVPRGKTYKELPFDECILSKSQVILPAGMRGRLEADEWKPILASELIFSRKLRKTIATGILVRAIPFLILAAVLYFLLPAVFPQPTTFCKNGYCSTGPLGSEIFPFVAFLVVSIGTPLLGMGYSKKVKLRADRRSADIVGTSSFQAVLAKIASVAPPGGAQAKRRFGGPVRSLPSLEERIASLQAYSGQV